jgi:hypothetical protein
MFNSLCHKVTECWKKHEFLDRIEEGNNNIITKTLRGMASFIVAGNNVARVIKQLPQFQGVANLNKTPPTVPYKIFTLDGRKIIHDPLLLNLTIDGSTVTGANRYVMGWRGDNFLMAGMVYAPWITRLHRVTDVENSVNCRDLRVSQDTSRKTVTMLECGQSAAKSFECKSSKYRLAA